MERRKWIWPAFLLLILAQLYVPASMIYEREQILKHGKAFLFRTMPVDPADAFRGRYITLNYEISNISIKRNLNLENNQMLYLLLGKDSAGYARVLSVSTLKPQGQTDYIRAELDYSYEQNDSLYLLSVDLPFDRLYMEESKAPVAEELYNKMATDPKAASAAVVIIKNGEAVLSDVLINGVSVGRVREMIND